MTGSLSLPNRWKSLLLFGALAGLLVAVEHSAVHRPEFRLHPQLLPVAVGLDVLVGLPALFYYLVVRRLGWPASTVGLAVGAALGVGRWLLPAGSLPALSWVGGGAEALGLGYSALRLRRILRAYRAARQQAPHFLENLLAACQLVLGPLAPLVVTEVAVLRYGLLGWWVRPEVGAGEQAFSTYRQSGFGALLGTLGGLVVLEGVAAHLLVAHWHPAVAWGLTVASAYSLLWLLAHGQAVRCRPVLLAGPALVVRVGFCWRATILRAQLAGWHLLSEAPAARPERLDTSRLLLAPPNLLLVFSEPQLVQGLFGRARAVRQLALYVDEPRALVQQLAAGRA